MLSKFSKLLKYQRHPKSIRYNVRRTIDFWLIDRTCATPERNTTMFCSASRILRADSTLVMLYDYFSIQHPTA